MKYWVVKGKRRRTRWSGFLEPGHETDWVTRRHPVAMKPGDRVFYWMASPDVCLIALGVVSRVDEAPDEKGESRFDIVSLTRRFQRPLTLDELRKEPLLAGASFLKSGPAGTVFPLSEAEAQRLHARAAEHNELPPDAASWFPLGDLAVQSGNSLLGEALIGEQEGVEPFDPTSIEDGRRR